MNTPSSFASYCDTVTDGAGVCVGVGGTGVGVGVGGTGVGVGVLVGFCFGRLIPEVRTLQRASSGL